MKYSTATVIVLAGASNALPTFSFPSFGLPSSSSSGSGSGFSFPSFPSSGGSGFSFPSFPSSGTGSGSGWGSLFPGVGNSGGSTPTTPSSPAPSFTQPNAPSGNSTGTVGSNCTPQGSGGGSTENGITRNNCCTDMTIIFARGTGELGNVGTVSGPPMFKAIRSKLGADRVTVQGVDYPADAGGNASQGGSGGPTMDKLIDQALAQCPDTKVVVAGYSQGAMVVHSAKPSSSKVAGAILFGDPLKRSYVGDLPMTSVKQFCGTSDAICGGGGDGGATGGHISYGSSAEAAAEFAIQVAGLA